MRNGGNAVNVGEYEVRSLECLGRCGFNGFTKGDVRGGLYGAQVALFIC